MNAKSAGAHVRCYRTGKQMDVRIIKAAHFAEANGALRDTLNAQMDFDERMVDLVRAIEPPESLRLLLAASHERALAAKLSLRSQWLHPAMLSVLAGAALIVGFFIWVEIDERADFPGKGAVQRMVATAQRMSGVELEPAHGPAGGLGDLFYMRGFEGFTLPPELARMTAVGTRVFKQNGRPIAQLAVDPHNALLFVFRGADLGVDLREGHAWKTFEEEGWVAAVREKSGLCTLIAFRGEMEEMEEFLGTLNP